MNRNPIFWGFSLLLSLLILCSCKENAKEQEQTNDAPKTAEVTLELQIPAELGEGAFWNHKTQELYWVDILGKKLYVYNPNTKLNTSFEMPSRIGTVVPQSDSTAVVALEDGIYIQNTRNGSLTRLSNVEADIPENRFNDGKCDPNGNLWVGSMHLAEKEPNAKFPVEPLQSCWIASLFLTELFGPKMIKPCIISIPPLRRFVHLIMMLNRLPFQMNAWR